MKKRYELLLSEEQEKEIQRRAEEIGFVKKSDYIRFIALMDPIFIKQINEIHEKVCKCLKKSENETDQEV